MKLEFAYPLAYAADCDMLENEEKVIVTDRNCVSLELRPFDIRTLKIRFELSERNGTL